MKIKLQIATMYAAFASVAIAAAGIAAFSRPFAKIRIGPAYILEFLFASWLLFALCATKWKTIRSVLLSVWAPLIFFLWGFFILLLRLTPDPFSRESILFSNIAQHSLLFVYPLVWTTVGSWLALTDSRFPRTILMLILGCSTITNIATSNIFNLSLGPLLIIPTMALFREALERKNDDHLRWTYRVSCIVLTCLTFWPFWSMWFQRLQRTSILLLAWMILALAFFMRTIRPRWVFVATSVLFFTSILIGGVFATYLLEREQIFNVIRERMTIVAPGLADRMFSPKLDHPGIVENTPDRVLVDSVPSPIATNPQNAILDFGRWMLRTFQHGEDMPSANNSKLFQMRVRRYMWSRALIQWHEHWILGIGFAQEVPDFVKPRIKNTGGFEYPGTPPVSGPHNSYLSILARMGVVGLALFALIVAQMARQIRYVMRGPVDWIVWMMILIPFNGAIHAVVNVGFESPHNCMLMWLAAGMLLGYRPHPSDENPARS